jgi:inner membrane protein
MPTPFTHPAAALAMAPWFRGLVHRRAVVTAGVALSVLPDIDVLGFHHGIAYAGMLGHRGLTHSLAFALVVSLPVAGALARRLHERFGTLWLYLGLALASHGLFDALTDGGMGVALLAPFSPERLFFPWHVVTVSPLRLESLLSSRGLAVARTELLWIWLPAAVLLLAGKWYARVVPKPPALPQGGRRRALW